MMLAVEDGVLRVLSLPCLPEEPFCGRLQVVLSPEWETLAHTAVLLWREGESFLQVPLTAGVGEIPEAFFQSRSPFYLRLTGEDGSRRISTNEICAAWEKRE